MGNSPFRSTLYRRGWRIVILALLAVHLTPTVCAQFARKNSVSKGPRATGLVVMPAKGKPHLIPIAIMVDGRFYDAGAYKADPVPMALEVGNVYEVERTGNSLGLFTINEDLQQKTNWIAEGTYHANGETVASAGHKAETKPREKDEGPPVLRRPGSEAPKPAPTAKADSKQVGPPAEAKPASAPPKQDTANTPPAKSEPEPDDPNIPKLRRGKPERSAEEKEEQPSPVPVANTSAKSAGKEAANAAISQTADIQTIPAISDADGPEPRPYTYEMTSKEEQAFRTKMMAMAADELRKGTNAFQPAKPISAGRPRPGVRTTAKAPEPSFDDLQLRVFDVSSSNEPILVMTATAHPPQSGKQEAKFADYYVTLVARSDINLDLRKLFWSVTDSEHLDVSPRLQLIDAVDADGDGRGELLFRQTSDAGSAYSIYRVTADQLWPLFEGTP